MRYGGYGIDEEEVTYLARGSKRTVSQEREGMTARARSQRNRTKLEPEHRGVVDLGQEEGLFPEQGGMAKGTHNHRTGEGQFLPVQSTGGRG